MTKTTPKLPKQQWMQSPNVQQLMAVLSQEGGEARFVGGCVRDALLERMVKDIDIACTHKPETVMELLQKANIRVVPTGIAHGTVTAVMGAEHFEITTLRRDVSCDGRHAEVEFTNRWEEDASRRDFTMNALYASANGTLTDFFEGIDDARNGRVRFIGDARARIQEDGLRILRFYRFFAHYGTPPMDSASVQACESLVGMIDQLSGERVQSEMLKLLTAEHPADVLETMASGGVLRHLIAEMPSAATWMALDLLPQIEMDAEMPIDPLRRLALLLRGCADPSATLATLATRWRLSGEQRRILRLLVGEGVEVPRLTPETPQTEQKRLIRRMGGAPMMHLCLVSWAEYLAQHPEQQRELREQFGPMVMFAENWLPPEFPVTGADVMAAGVPEGPEVGRVLALLEHAWEQAEYALDRDALLKSLKEKGLA